MDGARPSDRAFTALDPPAALAVVDAVSDDAERTRLRLLYARTRGMLVDGTGWSHPVTSPPVELADGESLVRPFGALGSTYRVRGFALVCYRLASGLPAAVLAFVAVARFAMPSLALGAAGAVVVICVVVAMVPLLSVTVFRGKKIS
jgi:hypothetical protein